MTETEVRPRPSPIIDWRIALPVAPEGPPIISVSTKRWSILTHWLLTALVTALTALRFSSPFRIGDHTFVYYGTGGGSMVFWAVLAGAIFFGLSYWLVRVGIFQNFPLIRRARKTYVSDMVEYNEKVQKICDDAANPIRDLWFPLCKYGKTGRSYYDAKIWWRTGSEANSFSVQDFWNVSYVAGNERLVRFPKCCYTPDPKKPGTAEFNWGPNATIQDPELL